MEKKSFVFYFDWMDLCEDLTQQELLEMMLAIVEYAENGENPTFSDRTLKAIWKTIKATLDHDRDKYEERCAINKRNGAKGGRPKKDYSEKTEKPKGFFEKPKKPDNDSEYDYEYDSDVVVVSSECDSESPDVPPSATPTTTTSARIINSWNGLKVTRNIRTIDNPEKRANHTEMAMYSLGGIDKFISFINGLDEQAYFQKRAEENKPLEYDWLINPGNLQNIVEGKYADKYSAVSGKKGEVVG